MFPFLLGTKCCSLFSILSLKFHICNFLICNKDNGVFDKIDVGFKQNTIVFLNFQMEYNQSDSTNC